LYIEFVDCLSHRRRVAVQYNLRSWRERLARENDRHRSPCDRVIEIQRKQRIVAIKNVTINEPFFAGHFPNLPIMPGVLIVEAIAQAGGALLLTEVEDRPNKLIMFTGIERAKFRRPVVPGDQLRIEVELKNWRVRPSMIAVRMEGIVYVGTKRVAEAVVSCQLVDSGRGRAPSDGIAEADEPEL